MLEPMRLLLCHAAAETRRKLVQTLDGLGDHTIEIHGTAGSLVDAALTRPPDLIVVGVDLPDFDGITALIRISLDHTVPAIVVTPQTSLSVVERALEDHVMAYVLAPVDVEQLKPTVLLVLRRFEQFQEIRGQVESLKDAMEDRKIIERAKGVLIARGGLSENEAHRTLQRKATSGRMKLIEAANAILQEAQAGAGTGTGTGTESADTRPTQEPGTGLATAPVGG